MASLNTHADFTRPNPELLIQSFFNALFRFFTARQNLTLKVYAWTRSCIVVFEFCNRAEYGILVVHVVVLILNVGYACMIDDQASKCFLASWFTKNVDPDQVEIAAHMESTDDRAGWVFNEEALWCRLVSGCVLEKQNQKIKFL